MARHEKNMELPLAEKIRLLESMEQMAVMMHVQRHRQNLPVDPKIAPLVDAMVAEEPAPYHSNPSASSRVSKEENTESKHPRTKLRGI